MKDADKTKEQLIAELKALRIDNKQLAGSLEELEEKHVAFFENSPIPIFITSIDNGRILDANKSGIDLSGFSSKEEFLKEFMTEQHYSAPNRRKEIINTLKTKGSIHKVQHEVIRKDGTPIWIESYGRLHPDKEHVISSVVDITKRRQAEDKLRSTEKQFELAIKGSSDGLWDWNVRTNEVYWSSQCNELLGYQDHEIESSFEKWEDLLHPDDRQPVFDALEKHVDKNISYDEDYRLKTKEGNYKWVNSRGQALRDTEGNAFRMVGSLRDITDRKHLEIELIHSEEHFRRAVVDAPVPIIIHAEDGRVLQISTTWTDLTGYSLSDIPTISDWTEKAYGHKKDVVKKDIDRLYALNGRIYDGEYDITTSTGEKRAWDFSSAPLGALSDGTRLVISIATDITERKKREEDFIKIRTALDNSSDAIAMTDTAMKVIYQNKSLLNMFGYTVEEMVKMDIPNAYWDVDFGIKGLEAIKNGKTWEGEVQIRSKDGSDQVCFVSASPICDDKGAIIGYFSRHMDITERKKLEADLKKSHQKLEKKVEERTANLKIANEQLKQEITERRQIEKVLRESKDRYQTLIETIPHGIQEINASGITTFVNEAYNRIYGYKKGEVIGKSALDNITHDSNREKLRDYMVTLAEDQPVPTPYFATNLTKEGNSIDIRADWNYKRDEKGRVAGFISVITDITEQKQAEEDLKKTRDHLYNIIESSLDSIVVADTKGHITRANISFCELAGYSKEEILGKCITELAPTKAGSYESSTGGMVKVNEKFIDNAKTTMQRLREGKKIYNWESYVLRKDKLLVPTEDTIVALHGEDGGKQEFLAIIRDITERKKSEQDLSESEEKYYKLMETANDAIFIAEAETGIITDANKKAEELLGVPIEEIIGMHQTHLFSKEDRDYYSKVFSDHIKIGKGVIDNTDIFVSNKNGSKIPVEVSYSVTEIAGKKIVQGIFRNITTRRKAEAEIRKSEEKYHKLMETANDAIFIAETETGIITDANKKAEELLGVPVKEIIGMHQDQFHAKEDRDYYRKLFADQAQIDKGFITGGLYVSHKNGHKVPIEISTSVTKIEGRTIMQGIFRDITERVNAEREIKEARYFFENIINTSLDGILITDSSGITTIVNPAFERMLDCSKDDLIGKHPSAFIPKGKEYEEEGREFIKQLIEKGTVLGRERILSRKDGTVLYVEQNAVFLKDAQGNLMGAAGSFRDITERKKAQEEIINHQNKLKSLTSQLTLVEEKERRRFADYLHDQIGQKLFISKLKLEVLKKSISSADQNKALGEIHEIILQMIKDTRSLTFDLSPPVLYQLGLGAALEWLTDQASAQYGIMVTFENDEEEKALADDTKVLIFQAVRELISNIAKHAQTDKAKISMQRDNVNIRICVEDDGVGFTPSNRTSPSSSTGGFGLFSIEERIDHLGGQFKIESKPGHGTKAVILAPLSD